ncbi:MAG: hypothetical protein R2729_21640 [Bryobacteraceae bacterium]
MRRSKSGPQADMRASVALSQPGEPTGSADRRRQAVTTTKSSPNNTPGDSREQGGVESLGVRGIWIVTVMVSSLAATAVAQPQNGLISSPVVPRIPTFERGHIGTLVVFGVDIQSARATAFPLPTELSGVSVLASGNGAEALAPILTIERCCRSQPMGAAISIQWPNITDHFGLGEVTVVLEGRRIARETVNFSGATRILSARCGTGPPIYALPESPECDRNERPLVAHADGEMVRSANPARPGETLVVYATGVMPGEPEVLPIGVPSPSPPIPIESQVLVSLDYAYNGGQNPETELMRSPEYAALTPGGVGLAQIHVKVPDDVPDGLLACPGFPRAPVRSNLTISVTGNAGGRDRIGICVDPGPFAGKQNPVPARRSASEELRFNPSRFPLE